mgnify:CR=1 FL=1
MSAEPVVFDHYFWERNRQSTEKPHLKKFGKQLNSKITGNWTWIFSKQKP